ncbi:myosin-binding protein 3 [Brachypodium distachyon]|nr:myosin-binding protein 3 [Brachypodium distachyon]XP_024318150.1 myosin-binding protein 3 [Brachypodium distachyon]XP_024318151.1 myosin-binding protein 3 [Brachypodium distachyon]|eukprot:XP_010235162.1 myosin-binding protein 3 [Brachypodium distachyon]
MEPFAKMAENESAQLQRAIFAQYIMMKKLFKELEEEKEASATAASAALSMIRKLQKEKEAERMEAWQYKRIAEERMIHNDRAMEIVKEVMQQKELEIYYLRNQLQVYKQRLLDVGIDDCDISDETIAKNIPLFESKGVENLCYNIKRNFSLPILQLNKPSEMDNKNDGAIQSPKSRLGVYMHNSSENELEQVSGDGTDLKDIKPKESLSTHIDSTEKCREESKSSSSGSLQNSYPSEESSGCSPSVMVNHQTDVCSQRETRIGEDAEDKLRRDPPRTSRSDNEVDKIAAQRTGDVDTLKAPEQSKAPDPSCTENGIKREESELSPAVVLKDKRVTKFAATRKVGSMNNVDRHVRVSAGNSTPRAAGNSTPRTMGNSTPRAGIERTRSRLKRVQSEKMIELNEPRKSKEQIIMLKEVYEQLNMIEAHMRPSSSQETPRNEQSLDSVMEAALSFSI